MIAPPCYDRINQIDCPKRIVGCRETCDRWKLYEEAKAIQYELKEKAYINLDVQFSYSRKYRIRNERRKRK